MVSHEHVEKVEKHGDVWQEGAQDEGPISARILFTAQQGCIEEDVGRGDHSSLTDSR